MIIAPVFLYFLTIFRVIFMYYKPIRHLKKVVWLNVITQISCSFLGLYNVAIAETVQPSTQKNSTIPSLITKIYTVEFGENTESILKKYNISLDLFYQLNPSYDATQGIPTLRVGDRINLPLNPFEREIATALRTEKQENKVEESIAKAVATTGGILSSDNAKGKEVSDQLQSMATNMLSNQASNALQQWLGQYGHARVQLGVDKDFSLKSSKYDFLAPLVDRENSLFFLQNSIHRTDDRTQTNVGLGLRYFADDYMLGGNTFWDYDISRGHSRAGVGVEYWRNYVKLAANNYFRLSGWKDSKDFNDYDERTANGWDLRAEAYLPAYPQLGAKINYEKYYGDEVALFGRNNLQKDPYAATVGLNYTPIPLLTLGAEHTRGQSNENDTKLSAQLNYRLGVPWAQQIDPRAVNSLRSLAGSRYDFVDRNNNIVLEYKKRETIKISLPQVIEGQAGDKVWVRADIISKYTVQDVNWNEVGITANGGSLNTNTLGMVEITLPEYDYNGSNQYPLSAQATDVNQNQSNVATTTVIVKSIPLAQAQLDLTTDKPNALADGQDQIKATATLLDKNNKPIANQIVKFEVPAGVSLSSVEAKTDAKGQVSVILTSAQVLAGQVIARLQNEPNKTASADFNFIADVATAEVSELVVTKNDSVANGQATNEVKATVKDASGNLLANQEVTFTADNGATVVTEKVTTDANGIAITSLTNTKSGTTNVTATINGTNKTVATNFIADVATAEVSELVVTKNDSVANGQDTNEVKATVKDASGNLLANQEVTFTADNGATVVNAKVTTDANGIAITSLTNTKAGAVTVTATINGMNKTAATNFIADITTAEVTELVVTQDGAMANGQATNEVKATVRNKAGDLLVNQDVIFTADNGATVVREKVTTDASGIAITTLTNIKSGITTVTATTNGTSKTVATNFIADVATAEVSELVVTQDGAMANGQATNEVKAIVRNASGESLANQEVTFTADNGATIVTEKVKTDANGIAVTTLTNTKTGIANVTASINGTNKTVATNFIADVATAEVSELVVTQDEAVANGQATNEVKATVRNKAGDLLANQEVTFTADNGATIVTEKVKTDANGIAVTTLTNTKSGTTNVTASINGTSKTVATKFIADESTAILSLEIVKDDAASDGKDRNEVKATLVDAHKNPIVGAKVNFSSSDKAFFDEWANTDENGETIVKIYAYILGERTINAEFNGKTASVQSSFGYEIKFAPTHIKIEGHSALEVGSSGFPKTVFKNASFQIINTFTSTPALDNGNMIWSSNNPFVKVDELGVVTIRDGFETNPVAEITIAPGKEPGNTRVFKIEPKQWMFSTPNQPSSDQTTASNFCSSNGASLGELNRISDGTIALNLSKNSLLNEWNYLPRYEGWSFIGGSTGWSSEPKGAVLLATGQHRSITSPGYPLCFKDL